MLKDILARKMKEQGEGFRCSDLSRKTGIPHDTILQILKGNTKNPGIQTITKIAQAFNSSIDELIGNIPENSFHNIKIKNPNLFLEIMTFISEKAKKDSRHFESSAIFKAILDTYLYCEEENKMNIKFAKWCIKNYLSNKE